MAMPVGEWTGFYLGGQAGYGNADATGFDGSGGLGGIHAGYMHDLGDWVIGGELDYDWTNISDGPVEVDNIARAKLIGGYDLGQSMIYATAGAFDADISGPGGASASDNGWLAGAGRKYAISDNWVAGVEALYHEADDFDGSGVDVDATTLTARISYKF